MARYALSLRDTNMRAATVPPVGEVSGKTTGADPVSKATTGALSRAVSKSLGLQPAPASAIRPS
jgi:hypothetical protein